MKLTKNKLEKIIKEELNIFLESPRMSGAMDPEDSSVMADIERQKDQGLEERVRDLYAQEISDLALIMSFHPEMSREEALADLAADPRVNLDEIEPDEINIILALAEREAEEM